MTKQFTVVDPNTDNFEVLYNRLNDLINASNTEYLTANSNANGSVTTGNVFLSGILHVTTMATSGLRGGNVQSSANLTVISNVVINAASFLYIGNSTQNVFANSSVVRINGNDLLPLHSQINVRTTGTSAQLLDTVAKSSYRGAEYVLVTSDNAANGFQMSKAMVFHDSGVDAYISEFGTMYSNSLLSMLSANANTTHIRIYITPTVANAQIKATKTVVAI